MDYLFECAQLVGLDFVESQKALGPPPRQFDGLDLFLGETVLGLILLNLSLSLLLGGVVAGIDDEVVFPGNPSFFHIVLEDLLEVEV